jgi:hypothetical protein
MECVSVSVSVPDRVDRDRREWCDVEAVLVVLLFGLLDVLTGLFGIDAAPPDFVLRCDFGCEESFSAKFGERSGEAASGDHTPSRSLPSPFDDRERE